MSEDDLAATAAYAARLRTTPDGLQVLELLSGPPEIRTPDPLIKSRRGSRHYPASIRPSCDAKAATAQRILATLGTGRAALRDASDAQGTPQFASSLQAKRGLALPDSGRRTTIEETYHLVSLVNRGGVHSGKLLRIE